MSVVIETTLGDVTVDLFLKERPRACLNFLKLCKIKYYNYNLFHTISRGFIAQTGDPTGSRKGGESIYGVIEGPSRRYFQGENEPRIKHTRMGLISFVGDEERMIGSQFFITLGENLTYLDEKHCVFGEVVEGFDALEIINETICDTDDRPYQDVRITHTVILDDPLPDPEHLQVPSRSPSPSAERLQGGRIAPDEDIDDTAGKSAREVEELIAEREAKARATILEMVGDIPDAEMAPPENVLFVCKLNPVTTDDDLEIIFSRFGKIKSCEVIRDKKSGDSLQYAFIEFEERKSCEDAYFKMDNVLIDDRRIHVDFSQSVAKVKWLGKGRGVAHFDDSGKKRIDKNNDIGKGNYKVQKRRRGSPDSRERSPVRKNGREREEYSRKAYYKRETKKERSRSPDASRIRRRSRSNDRRERERRLEKQRDRHYDSRNRSRTPRRNGSDRADRRDHSKYSSVDRSSTKDDRHSKTRYEERSSKRDTKSERRRDRNRSVSTDRSKRKSKKEDSGSESESEEEKHKKQRKRRDSSSEESSSSSDEKKKKVKKRKRHEEKEKSSGDRKLRTKKKKKTKKYSESESDSDNSSDDRHKKLSKKKKKKRKYQSSSDSD